MVGVVGVIGVVGVVGVMGVTSVVCVGIGLAGGWLVGWWVHGCVDGGRAVCRPVRRVGEQAGGRTRGGLCVFWHAVVSLFTPGRPSRPACIDRGTTQSPCSHTLCPDPGAMIQREVARTLGRDRCHSPRGRDLLQACGPAAARGSATSAWPWPPERGSEQTLPAFAAKQGWLLDV